MQVSIRFAETEADHEAIYRLLYDVYIVELGRGYQADHVGHRMVDASSRPSRVLLAEHDGQVIGTMRLDWGGDGQFSPDEWVTYRLDGLSRVIAPNQILIFSRFATRASYRGGDVPGHLIDALIRFAIAHDVCAILCDCRPHLINTYLRLGFRVLAPIVNTAAAGILVPLILLLDDRPHIKATASRINPLLDGLSANEMRCGKLLALLPREPIVETLEQPEQAPEWTRMVQLFTEISPERFPIFQGLPVEDIARLTTMSHVLACSAGDLIVRHGSTDMTVFVVLDGTVDVLREGQVVAQLQPGSVFGEVAFLAQVPRSADVVAGRNSQLVCLRPNTLAALMEKEPSVAAPLLLNLSRILAQRLAAGTRARTDSPAI
jgi:GNAT superfamily N-acetyltransferase